MEWPESLIIYDDKREQSLLKMQRVKKWKKAEREWKKTTTNTIKVKKKNKILNVREKQINKLTHQRPHKTPPKIKYHSRATAYAKYTSANQKRD